MSFPSHGTLIASLSRDHVDATQYIFFYFIIPTDLNFLNHAILKFEIKIK
jgi:hypothetical protein